MNYEDLSKRIHKARESRKRATVSTWWDGYVAALLTIRDDIYTESDQPYIWRINDDIN